MFPGSRWFHAFAHLCGLQSWIPVTSGLLRVCIVVATLPPLPMSLAWATVVFLGTWPITGRAGVIVCSRGHKANSIAFGCAPRREADSQPISPLARPAVSQTETHSLGFLSVADAAPSSGETIRLRASSGRIVMQPTADFLVGSSKPGGANVAPPTLVGRMWRRRRRRRLAVQDSNRRPKTVRQLCYHSTGSGVKAICPPTAWSLLSEKC